MDQQIQANKMVLFQQKEPPYNFFYINYPSGLITAQNAAFLQQAIQQQHTTMTKEAEPFKKEATLPHMSLLQHYPAAILLQLQNNYLKQVNGNINDPRTNDKQVNNIVGNLVRSRWEARQNLEKLSVNKNQNVMLRQKQYLLNRNQSYNNGMSHPKVLAAMKRTKAGRADYQYHTRNLDNVKEKRKRQEDDDDEVVVIDMKRIRDDEVAEIDLELRL